MNIYQLKTNIVYLLLATILSSTSTFAQFICDIEPRNWFYQEEPLYGRPLDPIEEATEFSGLAYHPQRNLLFMPLCNPACPLDSNDDYKPICPPDEPDIGYFRNCPNPSISMRGYNFDENNAFDIQFSDAEAFTGCDFEGMTHLKDDYFALVEETENKIYFLKYRSKDLQFDVLDADVTDILPNDDPNNEGNKFGLGGITYDPNTGRLYVIDEYKYELYSTSIVFPGDNDNGSTEFTVGDFANSKVNLGNIANKPVATGLFHLGQIYPTNHPLASNMFVSFFGKNTFPFTKKLIEYKILLDLNNDLTGSPEPKYEVDFNEYPDAVGYPEHKPEGIVAVDNKIYVASESYGLSSYNIASMYDDCTLNENDFKVYDQNCDCVLVNCETDVIVEATETNTPIELQIFYESSQKIETQTTTALSTDVIVNENEAINLKSNHITLNEGFKVESGACLNATIEPCEE